MWEEIKNEDGRVYFWNTATDEVSWEKPLKNKQKTYVKTEINVKQDSVKLRLIKCQPKDKIINRIWNQLSQAQCEMIELEKMYSANILKKVVSMSFCSYLTRHFHTWKINTFMYTMYEKIVKTINFTRLRESLEYKKSFCQTIKMMVTERNLLLTELAITKTKLAQENYLKLKK